MAASTLHRLIKILVLLVLVLLCLSVGTGILVKKIVSKDFLKEQLEKSINSEVSIGGVELSIFNFPAKVVVTDVSLRSRQGAAIGEAPVKIGEMSLSIEWLALFQKQIDVREIRIEDVDLKITCFKDGTTSLATLFESPDAQDQKGQDQAGKKEGFNIHEQGEFVASLGKFSLADVDIDLMLEAMGMELQFRGLQVELSSIKVDPENLADANEAQLKASSLIKVYSDNKDHYGDLYLDGLAEVSLFNVVTGGIEPEVDGSLSLSDESWLGTNIPWLSRAWANLSILEKVGIRVGAMPQRATFGRSKSIAAHYHQGRILVRKPLSIWVSDWEVAVLDESWLDTKTDKHDMRGELLASQKASAAMTPAIAKGLEMIPEELRQGVADQVRDNLFRDDRLLVKIKSSGDFSDPKVRPDGKIIDVSKATQKATEGLIKKKAGSLLRDLLK
ncbi:MAG: AsmA family protein [Akkermansiaceae bacterium]